VELSVLRIAQTGLFAKTIKELRHIGEKVPFPLVTRIAFQALFELGFNLLGALFCERHSKSFRLGDVFLKATETKAMR
jgi:hypothetical protein